LYIFGKDNPLSGSGSFWQHDQHRRPSP
jgi:hypothetical protein